MSAASAGGAETAEPFSSAAPALVASFGAWFGFQWAVPGRGFTPDAQALLFMAWALPARTWMLLTLYATGVLERVRLRTARRRPLPSPA